MGEELEEVLRVQDELGEALVVEAHSQQLAADHRHLRILVAQHQVIEQLAVLLEEIDARLPPRDLATHQIAEQNHKVLLGLDHITPSHHTTPHHTTPHHITFHSLMA